MGSSLAPRFNFERGGRVTYTILDLFCGAGGASAGYDDAGFEVVGVDLNPQPNYPYEFIQMDALDALRALLDGDSLGIRWQFDFDAIHASPPCQTYSVASRCRPGLASKYPDLVDPVRGLLDKIGLPYVIENVEGSPLRSPVLLCGSMFGASVLWNGQRYEMQRHRLFEANWELQGPMRYPHAYPSFPVYGHGRQNYQTWFRGAPMAKMARQVMQTPWMTRDEFCESIPPYYTAYIGTQLRQRIRSTRNEAA